MHQADVVHRLYLGIHITPKCPNSLRGISQMPFTCEDKHDKTDRTPAQLLKSPFLSFLIMWKFPLDLISLNPRDINSYLVPTSASQKHTPNCRPYLPTCGKHRSLPGLQSRRQARNGMKSTTQGFPPPSSESVSSAPFWPWLWCVCGCTRGSSVPVASEPMTVSPDFMHVAHNFSSGPLANQ